MASSFRSISSSSAMVTLAFFTPSSAGGATALNLEKRRQEPDQIGLGGRETDFRVKGFPSLTARTRGDGGGAPGRVSVVESS